MSQPGQIVVGQLYLGGDRNGLPVWSQPGGVGTRVYPQLPRVFPWFGGENRANIIKDGIYQWPASYPANYFWGCGHPANTAEIYSYYDPYAEEIMAVVCCSMCSYIVQLMPYTQYQNNLETPLIVA